MEELSLATLDLLKRLASQHVVYAEIRFCPPLQTRYTFTQPHG
jgi:adenosine deaminase